MLRLLMLTVGLLLSVVGDIQGLTWKTPPDVFSPGPNGGDFGLAVDPNGNAFTAWVDSGNLFVSRFSNATQSYGPAVTISLSGTVTAIGIATDATGTALLVWKDLNLPSVFSAYYNGTTWVTPTPSPLDNVSSGLGSGPSVSMDGSGHGLVVWQDLDGVTPGDIRASFFDPNTISWGPFTTLSTGGTNPIADFSSDGTAVAVFSDAASNLLASNFDGLVWSAVPTTIGTAISPFAQYGVKIDAAGNAVALWIDSATSNIFSSYFTGVWGTPDNVSQGIIPVDGLFSFDMAPTGYAIAVWSNGTSGFYSEFFGGGGVWTTPLPFSIVATRAAVAVDSVGNALMVYNTPGGAFSILKPFGAPLGTPDLISPDSAALQVVFAGLADNGRGFVDGGEFGDGFESIAGTYTLIALPSPIISGSVCKDKFASQADRIHIITWIPSTDPGVFAYFLRRNGELIAIIPATGPFIYFDHNRCNTTDTYSLTAVTAAGESPPAVVTLR